MRPALLLGLFLLAGCANAPQIPTSTPFPTPTSAPITPTSTADVPAEFILWVAPAFAPNPETLAGIVLLERLETFQNDHPDIQVIVRTKAEKGPGGLMESLSAASRAAPATLPHLITLDPEALSTTALSGLLAPLPELGNPSDNYAFADDTSRVDGIRYAQPFASDMETFASEMAAFEAVPLSWTDLIMDANNFIIPAADPEAIFLIAQYLSLGGEFIDRLDENVLAEALDFLAIAAESGNLSSASFDLSTSGETWLALQERRSEAAQAPYGAFFASHDPGMHALGPLPTRNGIGIALAAPWSWAVANPEQEDLSGELIEWLTEPAFLAEWSHALGLLPTQPDVLEQWPGGPEAATASRIVSVAVAKPRGALLEAIGPPLAEAVQAVLTGRLDPEAAAAQAVADINRSEF
ncbi:MAG: extracellular solute-binding protein [Anaerolineales bacterium]